MYVHIYRNIKGKKNVDYICTFVYIYIHTLVAILIQSLLHRRASFLWAEAPVAVATNTILGPAFLNAPWQHGQDLWVTGFIFFNTHMYIYIYTYVCMYVCIS